MNFIHRLWRKALGRSRQTNPVRVRFPSENDLLESIRPDFSTNAGANSKQTLVKYYQQRLTPRFLITSSEITDAIHLVDKEHPGWRDPLLEETRDWCTAYEAKHGIAIGHRGAIDWTALPTGPGNDHIYRDRAHLFSFMPRLALASLFGASSRDDLQHNLESWMSYVEQTPDCAAYSSCLIVAYRIVALSWTFAFLSAAKQEDFELEFLLLRILLNEGRFLHERLGTSFPNNHLLGDAFALWYLGTLFPEFGESAEWKNQGEAVWLQQFSRQVYPDGTSFEHALHYHELVCEMAVAYVLLHQRNGWQIDEWVIARTERMLEFKAALNGEDATPLPLGDAVEDSLFPLDGGDGWGCAAYYEIFRALFRPNLPPAIPTLPAVERAFWLLGGKLAASETTAPTTTKFSAYPNGGYFLFPDTALHSRLLFRSGPAPDETLNPGHMHADLLSIYLHFNGHPLIVEAGTYTYRSNMRNWPDGTPPWRVHFLSPQAHNGLCLEHLDPLARGEGNFPGKPIQSRCLSEVQIATNKFAWAAARVVGQTAYDGHCRGVFHLIGQYWLIYDRLPEAVLSHPASLGYQLAANAEVIEQHEQAVLVSVDDSALWLAASGGLAPPRCTKGQMAPPEGWVSTRYGVLQAASMVRFPVEQQSGQRFVATLLLPKHASASAPQIEALAMNASHAFRITHEDRQDFLFMTEKETTSAGEAWGIRFSGKLLWLQTLHGKPAAMLWHEGSLLDWPDAALRIEGACRTLAIDTETGSPRVEGNTPPAVAIRWPTGQA